MAGVEKLASSGFAKTAYLIGELVSDAAGRDELCETIIKEHGLALCPAATAPSARAGWALRAWRGRRLTTAAGHNVQA